MKRSHYIDSPPVCQNLFGSFAVQKLMTGHKLADNLPQKYRGAVLPASLFRSLLSPAPLQASTVTTLVLPLYVNATIRQLSTYNSILLQVHIEVFH
jgi:hypothetical protein